MNKYLTKELHRREYYKKRQEDNKEKMRNYHREYMRVRRLKQRENKLSEQRKNPTWWIFVKKSTDFINKILTSN